jgi:flavodoxin
MDGKGGRRTIPRNEGDVRKILVAYFSRSGNTREIADQIQKNPGGDIFKVQAEKLYPNECDAVVKQVRYELDSGYKPGPKTRLESIRSYDMIFIDYPNWWSTFPAPVKTFFSEYDLSGKTIAPFCRHEGSGLGRSVADIQNSARNRPCWKVLP